jgi:hypothetical protein
VHNNLVRLAKTDQLNRPTDFFGPVSLASVSQLMDRTKFLRTAEELKVCSLVFRRRMVCKRHYADLINWLKFDHFYCSAVFSTVRHVVPYTSPTAKLGTKLQKDFI